MKPVSSPLCPPVALSIAGSDNSAGAGVQADLKTFSALGVYGLTAVTCVVAEVPDEVAAIQPIDPRIVGKQVEVSFEAFPIAAVKTGMLYSREIIETVADILRGTFAERESRPFLVVDPVMVASSGDPLLESEAVLAYREQLFPLADLVTPNLDEAAALLGSTVGNAEEMHRAGGELVRQFGTAFLVKGGHLRGADALDLLFAGGAVHEYSEPYVEGVTTHGSGCTYSAAIAAHTARGLPIEKAVGEAKKYITQAIREHFQWRDNGRETTALGHFEGRMR